MRPDDVDFLSTKALATTNTQKIKRSLSLEKKTTTKTMPIITFI